MNPYNPTTARVSEKSSFKPSFLWWFYFGFLCLGTLAGFIVLVVRPPSGALLLLASVSSVIDVFSLAGLFCYIRQISLFSKVFWRIIFFICVAKVGYGLLASFKNLIEFSGLEQRVTLSIILGGLLYIPLMIGLFKYGSSEIFSEKRLNV